jgi:NADH pyrophosphatase NudC (nudix superfamily)
MRADEFRDACLDPAWGRVELGESSENALRREVLEESGLDDVADELVGVYYKPYKDDIVLFFRARAVGSNPWQPNDEISHMDYFGRYELHQPMGLGARTRIIDALEGVTGSCVSIRARVRRFMRKRPRLDDQ